MSASCTARRWRRASPQAGIRHHRITVAPGEATKRFSVLEEVVDQILSHRLERGDIVLALGGGVVGDLAGFAAAIVRRGMRFVQMPTSLLAQVDSSVGGKTGINSRHGKNLIGAFHQPGLVLADTDVLDTPHEREFRAGYAEVAKYGLIDDPAFFGWLRGNWRGVFAGGRERDHAIATLLPRQGGDRRPRRARDRRPRPAQSRPHLRPCAGGGHGL
jgi:3-dehydroquinate synthase